MTSLDPSAYHEHTRRRGVNPVVYVVARLILQPLMTVYFRLSRQGRQNIPETGPLLFAANHRSFLDPFIIGISTRRPIYYMAKRELFKIRPVGWVLSRLGAFPVSRGAADEEAMATARALLERGQAVVIFPEGTRIRHGSLASPRRGIGRLALETGAAVVPVAVTGSEHARRGWRFRPVKVRLRFGPPLTYPRVEQPSPHLAEQVTARIWPCVQLQWEWLGGLPPLRTVAVVGAGAMGTALAELLARAGLEVQLGCRTAEQAGALGAAGENRRHLEGVRLSERVRVGTVADIEFAAADLVVLAVPSRDLPAAVAQIGARVGSRSALLVAAKGLVPPLADTPTEYVARRIPSRGIAALGGACHAAEAVEHGAAVVVASADADLRRDLGEALSRAGLDVERTDDVVGAELAGVAKNAAALAAAAAGEDRPNSAGAAAGRVFAEVSDLALRRGANVETLVGLAGVGDLIGTAVAEGSRNRGAGELLGRGVAPDEVERRLLGTPEAFGTVPQLAAALRRADLAAPVTTALAELVEGRLPAELWRETATHGERRRAA